MQNKPSRGWEDTDWEKQFAKDIPDKGLLSKIYNEHLKLNKRKQGTQLENEPKTWTVTSPKKASKQLASKQWKDAPGDKLSGKCTLK